MTMARKSLAAAFFLIALAWITFAWPEQVSANPVNFAPAAKSETTFPSLSPILLLNDGNTDSAWSSTVSATFPGYITLDLDKTAIKTDKIAFVTWYGQGQGVTNVDVEYFANNQWHVAVQDVGIIWNTNDGTKEVKEVTFPEVTTNKLRVKVNSANTSWGNIAINELQWWGTELPPAIVNVAPDGEIAVSGAQYSGGTGALNDEDEQTEWSGTPFSNAPVILELDRGAPRMRTDKLTFVASSAGTPPNLNVDVEYYNGDDWVALKQGVSLVWSPPSGGLIRADVEYDPTTAGKIRVKFHPVSPAQPISIREWQVWGYTIEPPGAQTQANLATGGTMTVSFAHAPSESPERLNDGDIRTGWTSLPNQTLPGTLTLTFAQAITTKKIGLVSPKGASEGISNVTVEYLQNQVWHEAASNVSVTWNTDSDAVEYAELNFAPVATTAIRVKVNSTRSNTGCVSLNEVIVWDANRVMPAEPPLAPLPEPANNPAPQPVLVNLAGFATASTTFPTLPNFHVEWINDGNPYSVWSSDTGIGFPNYITLDWGNGTIKTDKITLYTWFAQGQGVTNLDVQAYQNGTWVTVAANQSIAWMTNDTTFEAADISFAPVVTGKIRLKVNQANLSWGNFALNELKVWEAP